MCDIVSSSVGWLVGAGPGLGLAHLSLHPLRTEGNHVLVCVYYYSAEFGNDVVFSPTKV